MRYLLYIYVRISYPAPIPSHDSMWHVNVNVESKKQNKINAFSNVNTSKISSLIQLNGVLAPIVVSSKILLLCGIEMSMMVVHGP